jgi:aryl-alcohol dehydrogenase-like predicted oxidoreductase
MKSLAHSDRFALPRYCSHQVYYSLVGRDVEWEALPLALDQGVGTMVWSPLAGGALSGKIRRNNPAPKDSRLGQITFVQYEDEILFKTLDAMDAIAKERGKSVAQVALNWLLRKPTVANIVVGARNEEQLKQNLGALGWSLTAEEVALLDTASAPRVPYPNWHQKGFPGQIPPLPSFAQ